MYSVCTALGFSSGKLMFDYNNRLGISTLVHVFTFTAYKYELTHYLCGLLALRKYYLHTVLQCTVQPHVIPPYTLLQCEMCV